MLECKRATDKHVFSFASLPEVDKKLAEKCKNKMDDANCEHWAGLGYCQSRANFMTDKCQHACNSCPKGNN